MLKREVTSAGLQRQEKQVGPEGCEHWNHRAPWLLAIGHRCHRCHSWDGSSAMRNNLHPYALVNPVECGMYQDRLFFMHQDLRAK